MYNLDNLKKIIRNPRAMIGVAHQFGMTANQFYYRRRGNRKHASLMDEDWDNLFLLDGCRYDLFEGTIDMAGDLDERISPGSESAEFLLSTFGGGTFHDTVYITANPHVFKLPEDTFHATINLLEDEWDSDLNTVPPAPMADAVRKANEDYPEKRLIAHFMQPHYPFIGECGRQLKQGGIGRRNEDGDVVDSVDEGDIWVKLQFRLDDVTSDVVWEAYRENLELVLEEIYKFLPDIDGKTVLSADHGNLVGDWIGPIPCRGYGHPPNLYVDELVRVPWFEIDGTRREISADPPVRYDDLAEDVVDDRLKNLGYKT